MPGTLPYSFRQGNRSEYLAQFILTALGVSTPVLRQEDIGVDFHCALAQRQGNILTFGSPYLVQIKSASESYIAYGGVSKKGDWKKKAIEWLFSQELPLLIGSIDKQNLSLDLFSTSSIWIKMHELLNAGELRLMPNIPDNKDEEVAGANPQKDPKLNGIGDGNYWNVYLGPPVVSISIHEVEDDEKIEKYKGILARVLEVDQANITYRRLRIPYSQWLLNIPTNELEESLRLGVISIVFGTIFEKD